MVENKVCSKCQTKKAISEFRLLGRGKEKVIKTLSCYSHLCVTCEGTYFKGRMTEYRKTNPRDSYNSYRNWAIKAKYGITIEDYNKLFESQSGRCAICERHQSVLKRKLAVDHNHSTNKIRSLLCDSCNRGLGMFVENPELLTKAASYLQKWTENK